MKNVFLVFILSSIGLYSSCDIKQKELNNCNFSGKSFENYNFSKKKMSNIDFSQANLFGAIFNKTKMKNVNFSNANLFGAFFVEAKLDNINFNNSDISSADFTGATISSTSFKTATQEDTIFGKMIIEQPDIISVDGCKMIIPKEKKLDWYSTMMKFVMDSGHSDEFIIGSLCKWHSGGTFNLKSISSISEKKEKFVINYNSCDFPVYVSTTDKEIHIKDMYNETCVKSAPSTYTGSSDASLKFVMVDFDVVCGFLGSCIPKNLNISGGAGEFSSSYSGASSGAIHKGYNGLAGQYNWSGQFNNKVCSGSFYISGTKRNYTIRVYDDCRDAGSGEF